MKAIVWMIVALSFACAFSGPAAAKTIHCEASLTHAKSMLIAPPEVAIDHLFPPYTKEKNEALTLWFEY